MTSEAGVIKCVCVSVFIPKQKEKRVEQNSVCFDHKKYVFNAKATDLFMHNMANKQNKKERKCITGA